VLHADSDEAFGALCGRSPSTSGDAPHPHPSRGAGGPRQRAAGRVLGPAGHVASGGVAALPSAVLLEPDGVLRPAVEAAVRRLGFEPGLAPAPVVFVNLGALGLCPALSRPRACLGRGIGRAVVVGYVAGRPLTGAAHALHGCCAQVLELRPGRDGAILTTFLLPPGLEAACLTAREADVLALLLAGATDRVAAATLGVAPSTVRSHARAVLRKAGVRDRRQLRRLDASPAAHGAACACGAPCEVRAPRTPRFAQVPAVAPDGPLMDNAGQTSGAAP
jgi:DNA-binding CsgD family transcriptional regulator